MNSVVENIVSENGVNIHVIPTKKYKTIHIVVKFKNELRRETITKRALLPYVLRQGTKNLPSEQALQLKLDDLYGAVLSIDGAKKGNHHIISFRLEIANQNYISNESTMIDKALGLLSDVIYHPLTIQNSFEPQIFNREKETLQQRIDAVIDDKMAYANMRLIDEMCAEETYALHIHGYKEDLKEITAENTYNYYKEMLKEDQIDVYVLGDFNEQTMLEKMKQTFVTGNSIEQSQTQEEVSHHKEPQTIIEKQDIQQAKLHIGYRTNCTFKDESYAALQVFNGIFGGFPSSKLFINVREKNSLAYYAASRIESHKGLLFVFSGIAGEDYAKAREIIEQQMIAMKNGEFTDTELSETKDLIVNQLLETLDHPQGIVELLYQQVLGNKKVTPDELIQNILQVTKDEVIQVASQIHEDTVYLLTTKESDINA